jgi:hypothetical protein
MPRLNPKVLAFVVAVICFNISAFAEQGVPVPASKSDKPKPMFGDYDTVWGKVHLQYRARPEFRSNADFNSDNSDRFYKIGQRVRIGASFNYKKWLKVYAALQDTRTFGTENTSVSNPSLDGTTALHQGWAEVSFAKDYLGFKIGRQQLVYGDQRLIGHLEWLDQGRVFDAIVFKVKYPLGQLDLFESVFTPANDGNMLSGATQFFGAYNTMHFLDKKIVFDLFVLGLMDTDDARKAGHTYGDDPEVPIPVTGDATVEEVAAFEAAVAKRDGDIAATQVNREIVTVGTRFRYDHRIIKTGLELAGQFGNANGNANLEHRALALHADVKAILPVFSKPFIGLEFNYGTGDDDPADGVSNKFHNLFPTNHAHYGYMDLASWSNTINMGVRAGFKPWKHFALALDYWFIAKANANDVWYNVTGGKQVLKSENRSDSSTMTDERLMGHELDLTLKFPIVKHFKVVAGASVFLPEYTLAGNGDVQFWTYTMLVASY